MLAPQTLPVTPLGVCCLLNPIYPQGYQCSCHQVLRSNFKIKARNSPGCLLSAHPIYPLIVLLVESYCLKVTSVTVLKFHNRPKLEAGCLLFAHPIYPLMVESYHLKVASVLQVLRSYVQPFTTKDGNSPGVYCLLNPIYPSYHPLRSPVC